MDPPGKPANRATITDRVAKLLGAQPWPGYNEQSADAVATWLEAVELDTARRVGSYERDHKDGSDVVAAAERSDPALPSTAPHSLTRLPSAVRVPAR